MATVISLFNHKGGVSKTTTAFNLGWAMAAAGKRVLLADFDPQCNLTGMVMGFQGVEDLEATYSALPANNVKDGLAPAFESQPRQIQAVEVHPVVGRENLFLLRGHIGLSEYETTLGIAQELSGSLLPLRNLPGSIRYMIDKTAEACNADYVLVDMSPSLGPLNQNLLTTSDYFIVPLHPDYFSSMALSSLARTLPRWQQWARTAHSIDTLATADYPFKAPAAKFAGAVIQKYRPRNGSASTAFQRWIDQLIGGLAVTLIPALQRAGMVDMQSFQELGIEPSQPLLEVADFNSLIAISQQYQVPVYEVSKEQAAQTGNVWKQMSESKAAFRAAFDGCALKLFALTANDAAADTL